MTQEIYTYQDLCNKAHRLLNDVARCMDDACPMQNSCLRRLAAKTAPEDFICSYCLTLREGDTCSSYTPAYND